MIENFKALTMSAIEAAPSVLITSPKSDEDGTAAVLGMYFVLHEKYPWKNIKIIIRGGENRRWSHLKYFEKIEFVSDIRSYISYFPVVIFLDSPQYCYWGITRDVLAQNQTTTICIDHHTTEADLFTLSCFDTHATSTSELIYRLFLKDETRINSKLAEILLIGIMGDTGSFKFVNLTKLSIYKDVQRLLGELEVDTQPFMLLSKRYTTKEITCLQEFLKNTSVVKNDRWPPCSLFYISQAFVRAHDFSDNELAEVSGFLVGALGGLIEDSTWGCVLYPRRDGTVRLKLRTQASGINVQKVVGGMKPTEIDGIMKLYGGGHSHASSVTFCAHQRSIQLDALLVATYFKTWLSQHRYDHVLDEVF